MTGHSLSIADAAAFAAIASEVAQTHGGPAAFHSYQTGYVNEVPALVGSGWPAPEEGPLPSESVGRQLSLPGIARDATKVQVLHWPHGHCDPKEQIRRVAERAKMALFPPWENGGAADINHREDRIVPLERRRSVPAAMPNGWYPSGTGWTRTWRECLRIRPSSLPPKIAKFFPFLGPPDDFENRRTFLIVAGSTWYYDQTADYETRVAFSVYSLPFAEGGEWTYRWDQIKLYRDRAERLARGLKDYLQEHPASPASIERRRQMGPTAAL